MARVVSNEVLGPIPKGHGHLSVELLEFLTPKDFLSLGCGLNPMSMGMSIL